MQVFSFDYDSHFERTHLMHQCNSHSTFVVNSADTVLTDVIDKHNNVYIPVSE